LTNTPKKNFTQSVELSISFSEINMEAPENKLNLNIILPNGRGKDVEIGVFADGDMNVNAKKISKHVLSKRELEDYATKKRRMRNFAKECYSFIAQADLMTVIGKNWGAVLAPRGKMPQPVPPNADLKTLIDRMKKTVKIKSKKNPVVHTPVGTADMSAEDLTANIMEVLNAIERQIHEDNIKSIYVKATMSPPVRIW